MTVRPVYEERTWLPPWVLILLWGACLVAAGALGYGAHRPGVLNVSPGGMVNPRLVLGGASALVLLAPLSITLLMGRLEVEVLSDRIQVAFGPARVIKTSKRYDEIVSADAITYRPIREFGGWGLRLRPGKAAWTVGGNQAVRVAQTSGWQLYIGSRFPHRLAERIRVAKQRFDRENRRHEENID